MDALILNKAIAAGLERMAVEDSERSMPDADKCNGDATPPAEEREHSSVTPDPVRFIGVQYSLAFLEIHLIIQTRILNGRAKEISEGSSTSCWRISDYASPIKVHMDLLVFE